MSLSSACLKEKKEWPRSFPKASCHASKGTQIEALPEGASAWALDVVKVDAKFVGLMEKLLSEVLIVPDRAAALKLRSGYPELTFVTKSR